MSNTKTTKKTTKTTATKKQVKSPVKTPKKSGALSRERNNYIIFGSGDFGKALVDRINKMDMKAKLFVIDKDINKINSIDKQKVDAAFGFDIASLTQNEPLPFKVPRKNRTWFIGFGGALQATIIAAKYIAENYPEDILFVKADNREQFKVLKAMDIQTLTLPDYTAAK